MDSWCFYQDKRRNDLKRPRETSNLIAIIDSRQMHKPGLESNQATPDLRHNARLENQHHHHSKHKTPSKEFQMITEGDSSPEMRHSVKASHDVRHNGIEASRHGVDKSPFLSSASQHRCRCRKLTENVTGADCDVTGQKCDDHRAERRRVRRRRSSFVRSANYSGT